MNTREVGTVLFFNNSKGFGYIKRDKDKKDFFVHFKNIRGKGREYRSLEQGQDVTFLITRDNKNREVADDVVVLALFSPEILHAITCPLREKVFKEPAVSTFTNKAKTIIIGCSYEQKELEKLGLKKGLHFYPNITLSIIVKALHTPEDKLDSLKKIEEFDTMDCVTLDKLEDPLIGPSGHSYSTSTVLHIIEVRRQKFNEEIFTDPKTQAKSDKNSFVANANLRRFIAVWPDYYAEQQTILSWIGKDCLSGQPTDILKMIGSFFTGKAQRGDYRALIHLASTRKSFYALFQPAVNAGLDKILFNHIARGEQDAAEAILKKLQAESKEEKASGENLLLKALNTPRTITDHADRTFKNITAFQLALWYLDRHMWQMLRKYLSKEVAAEQFKQHEEGFPEYVKEHGKHYDFEDTSGIVIALQTYVDYFDAPDFNWDKAVQIWKTVVGGAQRGLPLHVIQEYCRADANFSPLTDDRFQETNLPRTVTFLREKPMTPLKIESFWESLSSDLGVFCGMYRGSASGSPLDQDPLISGHLTSAGAGAWSVMSEAQLDMGAIGCLSQVRKKEYNQLKKELEAVLDLSRESSLPSLSF